MNSFNRKIQFSTIFKREKAIQFILDEFESEKDFKVWLKSLSLSELLEVHYSLHCEINRIRRIILDSVKVDKEEKEKEKLPVYKVG